MGREYELKNLVPPSRKHILERLKYYPRYYLILKSELVEVSDNGPGLER